MKLIYIRKTASKVCNRFLKSPKSILLLLCVAAFNLSYAQVAAKWTFETSVPTTSGPITAEIGTGTATCYHASPTTTYNNPTGNGSADAYGSNNWVAGEYYQFYTSTTGLANVVFAFDQTSTATGPESFMIQISTNGLSYTTLAGSNYDVTTDAWSATASNYMSSSHHSFSIPQLNNQADVYIRITVASGSTAVNGGAIGGGGTSRVDNVTIGTGSALPLSITDFKIAKSASGNLLQWKTAMEKGLDYFSIEKSLDGKCFNEIDKVNAFNNIQGNDYQILDNTTTQNACYRIRIIEENGASTLSNIVYSAGFGHKSFVTCLSNMVSDNQPLLLNINGGKCHYWVINEEGKILSHAEDDKESARSVLINFNLLPKGLYLLKTSINAEQQTFKILKQ